MMQDKLHIAIHNIPVELRAQQQWLLNSISISPGAPGFPRFEAKTSLAQLEFQVTFLASWQTADLPPERLVVVQRRGRILPRHVCPL